MAFTRQEIAQAIVTSEKHAKDNEVLAGVYPFDLVCRRHARLRGYGELLEWAHISQALWKPVGP